MSGAAGARQARLLEDVLKMPGNDVCADCRSQSPRWASVNLGIFLCVQCASVHRKMGTHHSRVKSVTMDTWTRDQVDTMRLIGNLQANALANPNSHPPPTSTAEFEERGGELEKYIRRKWEYGSFRGDGGARAGSPTGRERRDHTKSVGLPGLDGRRSKNEELNDILQPRTKDSPLPSLPPPSPNRSTPVFSRPSTTADAKQGRQAAKGLVQENWADLLGMGESVGAPAVVENRPRLQYAVAAPPVAQAPAPAPPAQPYPPQWPQQSQPAMSYSAHPFPLALPYTQPTQLSYAPQSLYAPQQPLYSPSLTAPFPLASTSPYSQYSGQSMGMGTGPYQQPGQPAPPQGTTQQGFVMGMMPGAGWAR